MIRQRSALTFWQVLVMTASLAGWWGMPGRRRSGLVVAGSAWLVEQAGKRGDGFEQQRVDAGSLVGGVLGVELVDGAAVLGLGGELAYPGGEGGAGESGWPPGAGWFAAAGGRGAAGPGHGQSRVSSATAFLAQASSTRSLPSAAAAMSAAVAALLRARGRPEATRCSRAMASSANRGSSRPARARWCLR